MNYSSFVSRPFGAGQVPKHYENVTDGRTLPSSIIGARRLVAIMVCFAGRELW